MIHLHSVVEKRIKPRLARSEVWNKFGRGHRSFFSYPLPLTSPMTHSAELITAVGSDGAFLVRPKGEDPSSGYILSVVYKGKPTHHALGGCDSGFFFSFPPLFSPP